jgi:hypothetical protein
MNPTKFHNYYNSFHDDNSQDAYDVVLLDNMSHKL